MHLISILQILSELLKFGSLISTRIRTASTSSSFLSWQTDFQSTDLVSKSGSENISPLSFLNDWHVSNNPTHL